MKTLLLDTAAWDLVLDINGDIAMASNPYALAQDAASACRTFSGECYYNTTLGVPYLTSFFGKPPNISLIKQKLAAQARIVPEVGAVKVFITSVVGRRVTGQVQVTDSTTGQTAAAAF